MPSSNSSKNSSSKIVQIRQQQAKAAGRHRVDNVPSSAGSSVKSDVSPSLARGGPARGGPVQDEVVQDEVVRDQQGGGQRGSNRKSRTFGQLNQVQRAPSSNSSGSEQGNGRKKVRTAPPPPSDTSDDDNQQQVQRKQPPVNSSRSIVSTSRAAPPRDQSTEKFHTLSKDGGDLFDEVLALFRRKFGQKGDPMVAMMYHMNEWCYKQTGGAHGGTYDKRCVESLDKYTQRCFANVQNSGDDDLTSISLMLSSLEKNAATAGKFDKNFFMDLQSAFVDKIRTGQLSTVLTLGKDGKGEPTVTKAGQFSKVQGKTAYPMEEFMRNVFSEDIDMKNVVSFVSTNRTVSDVARDWMGTFIRGSTVAKQVADLKGNKHLPDAFNNGIIYRALGTEANLVSVKDSKQQYYNISPGTPMYKFIEKHWAFFSSIMSKKDEAVITNGSMTQVGKDGSTTEASGFWLPFGNVTNLTSAMFPHIEGGVRVPAADVGVAALAIAFMIENELSDKSKFRTSAK